MPSAYNGGYTHEPYGHNAYIDTTYGDTQQFPYYDAYTYTPLYHGNGQSCYNYAYQSSQAAYPGAYGPYPGASGAYRPYPQPQPSPPRRSRTTSSRLFQPSVRTNATPSRKLRGISADIYDKRQFKSFSGPLKKPSPIYRRCREPHAYRLGPYQETEFGGAPVDYSSHIGRSNEAPTTLRRLRPFYAPSYATYPPSTMLRTEKKLDARKYPIFARVTMKIAQLIIAAVILGLVLGPMHGTSFHDFIIRTNTEWQGVVVGIVSTWGILTLLLLLTSFVANTIHLWRKLDAHVTLIGILAYLLASCLEAYYAACYPPNGRRINLVCYRTEWIIATILCFINTALFVIDFAMSWISGVDML
ncbi:hypothetical protein DICVIV_03873 [Dictyocaulus viviparus]|uniref:MARVEL domain-containing protein n=1 Tax=Dictyocaulus viviparus TaxID=29172 RepID=A0A0D8XZV5_DICVI|nr:hypothetical protein DICVIV_03873 [Dictyocaulus viviparus]